MKLLTVLEEENSNKWKSDIQILNKIKHHISEKVAKQCLNTVHRPNAI